MPSSDQETYDLYADQLKSLKLGYGLYEPEPNEDEGPIEIADIGYIDSGRFVRFANAFQPQPGIPAINARHQATLKLGRLDSGVMASRRVSHKKIEVGISATEPTSGASIGTSIRFSCKSDRGASLITRHRSKVEKAKFHNVLQDHFITHLYSYKRIADDEQFPIKNLHDIVLIVRRVMTGDWATIVFHSGTQESDVSFDIKVATVTASGRVWGKWSEFTSFPKRHGPTRSIPLSDDEEPSDDVLDQCIFVSPFRVSDIVWYKKVKLALMQKSGSMTSPMSHSRGNSAGENQPSSPRSSQASPQTAMDYSTQPYDCDDVLAAYEVLAFHAFNHDAGNPNFDLICIDETDVQYYQPVRDACTIGDLESVSMDLHVVPACSDTTLSSIKVGRLLYQSSTFEDEGYISLPNNNAFDSVAGGPEGPENDGTSTWIHEPNYPVKVLTHGRSQLADPGLFSSFSASPGDLHGPPLPSLSDPAMESSSSRNNPWPVHGPIHPGQPYRRNPPAQRSNWVMWVGNVPNGATHDELLHFFTRSSVVHGPVPQLFNSQTSVLPTGGLSPGGSDALGESSGTHSNGVTSIFLISRSNCAFVNYDTEAHLSEAVKKFNGTPLRPDDPRFLKLVCRVRRDGGDSRAAVGEQKGVARHALWIKEQVERRKAQMQSSSTGEDRALGNEDDSEDDSSSSESSQESSDFFPSHHFSSDGGQSSTYQSSSSNTTYTSTSSGFLQRHFPKRYFILKSLALDNLETSVRGGLWTTQLHNEAILNQAYRTSNDVFLIFSVNKSGEFFGYAKMAGPIDIPQERISWTSREYSHSHPPAVSLPTSIIESAIPEEKEVGSASDGTYGGGGNDEPIFSSEKNRLRGDFLHHMLDRNFKSLDLDVRAPKRGLSHPPPLTEGVDDDGSSASTGEGAPTQWGTPFKIKWINTQRLPFHRTRHLRNPWNHDREVKVSRDGTELEPAVGQALLDEWNSSEQTTK